MPASSITCAGACLLHRGAALAERNPLADARLVPANHVDADEPRHLLTGVQLCAELRAEVAHLELVGLVGGRDEPALDGVDALLGAVDPEDHQLLAARLRREPCADCRVVV